MTLLVFVRKFWCDLEFDLLGSVNVSSVCYLDWVGYCGVFDLATIWLCIAFSVVA